MKDRTMDDSNAWMDETWSELVEKTQLMITRIGDRSPHVTVDGIYDDMRPDWWTSGFYPGMLWILYDMTGDRSYREWAWSWDERLEQCFTRESNLHHDVGFQFLPTAVMKFKLTSDRDARRRGLFAANFLAGRFNLAGPYLRAWNPIASPEAWNRHNTGWAIIDSMMNLSLLYWASEEIQDPRFAHIATAHADTVLRHFIRADGSVLHIASFDPSSGQFIESIGGQGFSPKSAWSRGAAWALYGMANTYRATGESRFLDASRRVADFFIEHLESDAVPLWDFRAEPREDQPRDTSAAACAASGMLELADLVGGEDGATYRDAALAILHSLATSYAAWNDPVYEGILREATGHYPAGQNINVSLIYGDYFFVEAMAKLRGWQHRIF